jgi:hypothetical protein
LGIALLCVFIGQQATADIAIIPGTPRKSTKIKCGNHEGEVSISSGAQVFVPREKTNQPQVENATAYRNAVALAYKGTNCADCKWLQFMWATFEVTANGQTQYAANSIPTAGGGLKLSKPGQPNWSVDSGTGTPYANDPATNQLISGDTNTFVDQPAVPSIPKPAGATAMTMVWHFDSFLVCGTPAKLCAEFSWTSTYNWTPGGGWANPTYAESDPQAPGTINGDQEKAFNDRFNPGGANTYPLPTR